MSGDMNPIHLDAGAARAAGFEGPVSHGMLSGAIFSRLFGTVFPCPGTVYLTQKFRFLKPALILILAFVGVKLLLLSAPPYLDVIGLSRGDPIKIDTTVSLLVVVGILALATVLSVAIPSRPSPRGAALGPGA